MADSAGNDITQVGVSVTGKIFIAPFGTTIPTNEELMTDPLVLNVAFKAIGLVKGGAGPQLAWSATGDPIEFWQDGYEIPSGEADTTLTFTAAEALGDIVRGIVAGAAPVDGITDVDGGGHATRYCVVVVEVFKTGAIRIRVNANATLRSTTEDQNNRGEVVGQQLVLAFGTSALHGNKHFREAVIPAA
jgi:hypothetical protein